MPVEISQTGRTIKKTIGNRWLEKARTSVTLRFHAVCQISLEEDIGIKEESSVLKYASGNTALKLAVLYGHNQCALSLLEKMVPSTQ